MLRFLCTRNPHDTTTQILLTPSDAVYSATYSAALALVLQRNFCTRIASTSSRSLHGQIRMTSGTMADAQPSQSSSPSDPASSAALKHEESNGYQLAFKHTSSRESLENAIAAGNAALQISPTDDGRRSKYMAALANLYLLKYKLLELPKDLDQAMALAMQAHPVNVDAVGGDNANRAFCLNILSCVVLADFKERARRTDRLHDVVEMARESVRLGSGDELNAPKYVGDLSWALLHRYQELGQGHDLVEAIQILEPLTLRLDRNHVNAGSCFRILGCCITPKSYLTGSKEGLSTAIKYLSEAVELTPHGFTDRPAALANLGIAFMRHYELTNCLQDLEDAVKWDEMSTACSGSIPPSLQSQLLNNLSSAKLRLFERKGNAADLVDSIKAAEMAVSLAEPINHPNLPSYLDKVCMVLLRKFESDAIRLHHSGNGDILDRAINSGKQAVSSVTQTSPSLPIFQTNLANVFLTRFEQDGSERDLDEAIDIYCAAYSKTDPTSEVYATRASNYGDALWWKFQRSGDEEVLAKSMDCAREAVSRGNKNSPDYPAYLNSLSSRLLRQFERGGSLDDLTQATDAASLAVKVSSELNHPDRRLYITTFATALWARFRQFGQLEDLELAKTILDEVIDWDREYPAKCGQLHNLANFCAARFMKLRSLSDLNEAIQHRKSTVKIATHGDPKRPLYLHGLTTDLHTRAAYIGSTADWNEAKACIEEAVELTPDKDVRRTMYLDSQAGIVLLLHDAYELATIDRAITLFKTAQESSNEKFKGQILANLALARHMRFRFSKSLGDLDLAEQSIRRSLNETGVSLEHIVKRQKCHASILLSRANASNSKNDVNEAIDILTKVVNNTSAIDGNRGFYLTALGEALYTRDGPGDKNSAAKLYAAAAGLENLNPAMRVISAKVAARLLSDTDPIKAQSLLAMAVRIMPELAPHQGDRSAAQKKVTAMYGTASDAAAFTLDCGFTSELAVALLDFGRFIIMGRILETRVDLKDLPNSLRREYEMLQNALDDGMEEIGFGLSDSEKREVRHRNAVSFEKLRVKIREIEGFHNFGLPYEEKDLVSDAAEGPIVVLNINARRSDALLITNGGVIQLPLDISPASVEEMSSKLHVAIETIQKTSGMYIPS